MEGSQLSVVEVQRRCDAMRDGCSGDGVSGDELVVVVVLLEGALVPGGGGRNE